MTLYSILGAMTTYDLCIRGQGHMTGTLEGVAMITYDLNILRGGAMTKSLACQEPQMEACHTLTLFLTPPPPPPPFPADTIHYCHSKRECL